MIKTFTQHELIQYVYNELTPRKTQELEAALLYDNALADACSDLLLTKEQLNTAQRTPSQKSVQAILTYSKTLSLQLQ
jgi:hypothetical protein